MLVMELKKEGNEVKRSWKVKSPGPNKTECLSEGDRQRRLRLYNQANHVERFDKDHSCKMSTPTAGQLKVGHRAKMNVDPAPPLPESESNEERMGMHRCGVLRVQCSQMPSNQSDNRETTAQRTQTKKVILASPFIHSYRTTDWSTRQKRGVASHNEGQVSGGRRGESAPL